MPQSRLKRFIPRPPVPLEAKSTLSFLSFFSRKRFRLIKNKKMNTHRENIRNFACDYVI